MFDNRYSQNVRPERLLSVTVKKPFQSVVGDHGATVLRVCRVIVGPVDADDAWSETFLSALKAYPDLPADSNIEAWLVTIAHRKAVDIVRSRSRHAVPTDNLPDRPVAARGEHRSDLLDALNRLSPRQKQSIAYHYLAGLPYADIAHITGSSPAAARRAAAADGIAVLRRTFTKGDPS